MAPVPPLFVTAFFLSLTFFVRWASDLYSKQDLLDELILQLEEPDGIVQGYLLQTEAGKNYYAYEGIPYAATPLRFQVPQKHEGWEVPLDARINNIACMQDMDWDENLHPDIIVTEDCLLINVYTPEILGRVRNQRPVLFWIHGGGFISEYGTLYDPKHLMDHGVIVVTFNYRLGPFGFLTTEDGVIPGNLGLKDQEFALRWVHTNIHLFGGNSSQVTIAGSSSGASSVSYHLLNEESNGLFRAAILQSGTSMNIWAFTNNAKETALDLAKAINPNFKSTKSEDVLKLLRNVPAEKLNEVANNMKLSSTGAPWLPVVENPVAKSPFVKEPMHEAFIQGHFNKVPILTGFTAEEALFMFTDPDILQTQAESTDETPSLLMDKKLNINVRNENLAGTELRAVYTDFMFGRDMESYVEALSNKFFTTAIIRQAELCVHHRVPVYLYQFSYSGIAREILAKNFTVEGNGVGHSEDLFYMWERGVNLTSRNDIRMRFTLLRLFTNFVKYLNPTPPSEEFLNKVTWPLTSSSSFQYLNINETLNVQAHPKHYESIRDIYEKYLGPPYMGF